MPNPKGIVISATQKEHLPFVPKQCRMRKGPWWQRSGEDALRLLLRSPKPPLIEDLMDVADGIARAI